MKKTILIIPAVLALFFAGCNNGQKDTQHNDATPMATDTVTSPPEHTADSEPPMDSAAMAKAWEAYMTPGDMHKWMTSTDGKWDAEFTFWEGKDTPPQTGTTAKAEYKTIMGGKYQEQNFKGKMFGMDFEGKGLNAYDNAKKKFISTWIDNMGTGMMLMEGNYDESTKTLNMTGTGVDPMTGKDCEMRQVLKIIDDKHQVMEMYNKKGGTEYKSMEIKLTKK